MPKPRSGWLTITPSGRWFFQASRPSVMLRPRKQLIASLGPFSKKKRLFRGLPSIQPGRIRTKVHWRFVNEYLKLGPILGILTIGDGLSFLGNKENFKDISLFGKKLGALVYVFTPDGINWEGKIVRGYLYDDQQNEWIESVLPFPHVVYNRVPSRKAESSSEVDETLNRIARLKNVTLFNRHFFDKQSLFYMLEGRREVASYLPETRKLDTLARLRAFCATYPFVYLKPVLGKAGQGIMRLEYTDHYWCLQRVHEQKVITRRFSTLEGVWKYIRQLIHRKKYIIQQGIQLAYYRGRPFDVRVLVQKNGRGEWGVTGIGIRRAGAQSITTHVPRGGSIQSLSKVLTTLFKEEAYTIEENIRRTALTIARTLNEEIDSLAEMSMDLGLTRDGELWFFEANAKPEKFDEPAIRRSSLSNLIRYAQFVSRIHEGRDSAVV
ncbi:YheC/YheD family protein [Brevibacillus sp. H7]|jgi:hypothetical protein|uniref:YheC/YheD family endospore coat-associated protein n=1 Tax=Brevibacillus sp. H7 TaxID=3349138 RepID=UPI003825F7FC